MVKKSKETAWEKMQRKMEEDREKTKSQGFPWMNISDPGSYTFRLMTPNNNFPIYMLYAQHYFGFGVKGIEPVGCPQITLGESCPVCELRDALPDKKSDRSIAEQKLFELLYPSKRYAFLVLNRKDKENPDALRILYTSAKVGKQILDNLTTFKDQGEDYDPLEVMKMVLDPKVGTDFFLKVEAGEKNRKTYIVQLNFVALNKKGIPIIKDEDGKFDEDAYERLLDTNVDWDELVEIPSYETAEDLLYKNLSISGFDLNDSEEIKYNEPEEEEEEDETEEEKPKPKPKKTKTKKTKPKPEPEEEEEDDDGDENDVRDDQSEEQPEPKEEEENEPKDDNEQKELTPAEKIKQIKASIKKKSEN